MDSHGFGVVNVAPLKGILAMNFTKALAVGIIIFLPVTGSAANRALLCEQVKGPRLDYFTHNSMSVENNKFLLGTDQVADTYVKFIFSDNRQDVAFMLGDAEQIKAQPLANNMKIVYATPSQISFFGEVNKVPTMASYYTAMQVVVYSQQSVWKGDTFKGLHSSLFYAKCHEDVANSPVVAAAPIAAPAPVQTVAPTQAAAPKVAEAEISPAPGVDQFTEAPVTNIMPVQAPEPKKPAVIKSARVDEDDLTTLTPNQNDDDYTSG